MKKIAIFGSYNGNSIGDTAILLGMLSSLERIYGQDILVNVLVTREIGLKKELKEINLKININEIVIGHYCKSSNFIKKTIFRLKNRFFSKTIYNMKRVDDALSGAEYLLIGGGNLIMDLYPIWPSLLQSICKAATELNIKYSFVGVGASPINTENGKAILKECLVGASKVYFRDKKSKETCENKLGVKDAFVMPDFALSLKSTYSNKRNTKKVLFNIASVYGNSWPEKDDNKFSQYIKGMVKLAFYVHSRYQFEKLVIFNSNYPTDKQGSEIFYEQLKSSGLKASIELIQGRKSVGELIELGKSAQFAFITRLHAGILMSLGGCKVIGVGYQPKVKDVLNESNISSYTIDLNDILNGIGFESIVDNAIKDNKTFINKNNPAEIDKILVDIMNKV